MEDLISQTSKIIDELLAAERRSAPQPRIAPEAFEDPQVLRPGRQGRSEAEVFEMLRQIVAQTPRSSDPRFFNQLFCAS